ncbi:MAG: sigma 54-interacting transcriptional regulator [Thermovenabulum sp.]|uniref:sigma 54-interacting transcriptional regulator n=1 Tax=Thermovenabulum sp. TaxID=3100335 RepID=UPI003C7A6F8F
MGKIGIIAPYRELYYETLSVKEEMKDYGKDIEVRIGLLSNAVDVAKDLLKNGAEVLISRGGTLNYIRCEFPNIPLVEIEISSYDIAEAIMKAKKVSSNIALVVFNNMLYESRDIAKLFEVNIRIFYIEREEQAIDAVRKAVDDGYDVIVGGGIANRVAAQMGLKSVLILSGKDSIFRSIKQAQDILRYKKDVVKQLKLIETVMENTPLGILTTDGNGRIKTVNSKALDIIKMPKEHVIGENIKDIIPEIRVEDNNFLTEINGSKIMVNVKHLDIISYNIGCIITLEEINEISRKEKYIRSAFVKKGHKARYNFENIIGKSQEISDCIKIAKKYSNFDSTVLIYGETGTGKEMFAQSIHNASKRAKGPFVAINCASLSETLMESELFGYVEGAFTGASKGGKTGLFEIAHGGTLFLDEISEMPLSIQAKLLRAIQEKAIMRLGDDRIIPVDVRIIAASNKDLYQQVKKGAFRADLYYRLNVLNLKVPPLRERKEDVILLFEHFLDIYSIKFNIEKPIIDTNGYEIIQKYHWPGNVRELENFTERLLAAYGSKYITSEEILYILGIEKDNILNPENSETISALTLKNFDEREIYRILKENNFNKTRTAKQLGIGRTTLWRILKKYQNL